MDIEITVLKLNGMLFTHIQLKSTTMWRELEINYYDEYNNVGKEDKYCRIPWKHRILKRLILQKVKLEQCLPEARDGNMKGSSKWNYTLGYSVDIVGYSASWCGIT